MIYLPYYYDLYEWSDLNLLTYPPEVIIRVEAILLFPVILGSALAQSEL